MVGKSNFSSQEKAEVILLGLKSPDTISEICRKHNIAPVTFTRWKKHYLEGGMNALKPVYVRKDNMIRAHVFLCVMGLLLYNCLLLIELVSDDLKHAEFVVEELNRESAEIFNRLDLADYIPG